MHACVIVAFWRRIYCLVQSFSCIDDGEAREWRCAGKQASWPRQIQRPFVWVWKPQEHHQHPSKQKIRKPWTWIPQHWFSWEAVSWFLSWGQSILDIWFPKVHKRGSYVDFHPSPLFPPTQLTLPLMLSLLLCSMTKICIGTLPCIGEIQHTFSLVKALCLME